MIRRNIVANYFGTAWTMLMGIAFLPVYLHYLGVEAYGLVGVFAVIQTWLLLLDAGVSPAVIRESSRLKAKGDGAEIRRVLRTSELLAAGAGLASFVVVAAGAFFLANIWLHTQSLTPTVVTESFLLMGVVIALRFSQNVYRGSFIGLERQVTLNVLTIIVTTIRAVGAVAILAWVANSVLAYFLWQAVVSMLTVVLFWVALYWRLPGSRADARFSRATLHRIWRFSAGTFLITVLGIFLGQTDKVVLSAILPLREFGYYAFAATIAGNVRSLVQPVFQGVYPRYVALAAAHDERRLALLYHRSCQLATVLVGSLSVWLIVFSDRVLTVWTRDAALAEKVGPVMILLLVGSTMNALLNGPYYLQLAEGWTSLLVRTNAVMAIIIAPAIWLAARSYGMIGGASAWVAVNSIYFLWLVPAVHRRILPEEQWRWWAGDILLPLAGAAAGALVCRSILPWPTSTPVALAELALAGVFILGGAALGSSHIRKFPALLLRGATYA